MALVTNGFRSASSPLRYSNISATVALGGGAATISSMVKDGMRRNIYAGEGGINKKSSIPAGCRHPAAWVMAPNSGGIASRNETKISTGSAGIAVAGKPVSGSILIELAANAIGGLIVSGQGAASISFSAAGSILSVAAAQGAANLTISSSANIGAKAGISGAGSISLAGAGSIMARGYMSGLSTSETEFSAAALAAAVWNAVGSEYITAGSMGKKLNDAGAGANPWTEIIESGLSAAEILRIIASVLAGEVSGAGTGTETFKGLDGSTERVISTVDSSGNRTAVAVDGS